MMTDLSRIDARLLLVCSSCGESFRRDPRQMGRPARVCPSCKRHRVPGDIPEREIERRYRDALAQSRAAGRFVISPADCWRDCAMCPVIDRGPETEVGVGFPEAW